MRRTGPFSARLIMILLFSGFFSRSAWRVMEMALATYETWPPSIAWLLEGGVQVNTIGVSVSVYNALANFRASIVFFELMVTLPASSCSAPPKDHNSARSAILVSSSWENPRPQG